MSTEDKQQSNDPGWALVELFGRTRIVGKVSEHTMGGQTFIRIDVPATKTDPAFTRFYGAAAIYCISPVEESLAKAMAENVGARPIERYEVPQLAEKFNRHEGSDEYNQA